MKESTDELTAALWKQPSKENWEKFSKMLKSGIKSNKIKYYRVVSKGKSIKESCAELLDPDEKPVTKVPMFIISNGKAMDAAMYLSGLSNIQDKEKERLMQQKLRALGYM